jgi:hypothetical protein
MFRRIILLLAGLALFATFLAGSEYDKRTVIRFNEPVIVAGVRTVTLEPGTYVVRLMNHDHNRNIVQFFNEREDHLYATVLAVPAYKVVPPPKTEFGFWETPRGNPIALRFWYPKGDNAGQEFVYPKGLAAKLAQDTGQTVLVTRAQTEAELETLPVTEVNPAGEERPFEIAMAPAPRPAPIPEPAPAAAPAPEPAPQAPAELPATASPFFTIGLLGALLTVAGFALRKVVA